MKVFLSSTYRDLIKHRAAATAALERLAVPTGRMEIFGARAEEPLTACIEEIEKCDLFVGVYAHRYGFTPNDEDRSITEIEYDYAKAREKPIFCFIVDEGFRWAKSLKEEEPGKGRLQLFLTTKIRARHVVDTFRSPDDLGSKVGTAIGRHLLDETGRRTRELHARALDLSISHDGDSVSVWITNVGTHVIEDIEVNAIPADDDWFERTHGPLPRLTSPGHGAVEITYPIAGGWFYARVQRLSPNRGVALGTFSLRPTDYTEMDVDVFWNDHGGLQRKSHATCNVRGTTGSISLKPRGQRA